ncbi:hypothetical protein OsI_21362 [Oryza sativa Indica Group]|uniref:SKP1-like protein n=1 Tax=Oryza sativa subsp. indica TaxID=39946 RepID=B8B1K9_ORYSI|nr:hypothetical protein OsI_21362 [Oryza sativa Indica Group]
MERKRVLVVGGSGYLGQHLLAALAAGGEVDVAFTHHRDTPPQPLLHALPGLRAFRVDLRSGDGLRAVSESFGQIIEYCTKHAAVEGRSTAAAELKRFDEELIDVDTDTLYHLLMAGNLMGVEGVLELAVQRTAELIRGKSPEEIRDTFKIANDFTPEEEEIIKENAWALQ